jgi:hypothetical protein
MFSLEQQAATTDLINRNKDKTKVQIVANGMTNSNLDWLQEVMPEDAHMKPNVLVSEVDS